MTQPVDAAQVLKAARVFGREVIEPDAETWEFGGTLPRDYFEAAAAHGLCGLRVATADGGAGLSLGEFAEVVEVLARHCLASAFALVVHNNLAAAIAAAGSVAQRERFLPGMLEGRSIGAFLLTEPGVGSDAQALQTSAIPRDGGWRLEGSKAWVSNSLQADVLCVYAQTELGAGARGVAAFLVEREQEGVFHDGCHEIIGGHALGAGVISFEGCLLDNTQQLFAPGEGLRRALEGIDIARVAVAAMSCGTLARALSEALRYTRKRQAFGGALAEQQGVQWMLADAATDLEAARGLVREAVAAVDGGSGFSLAAAHAKKFATRVAFARIADCAQVMGAAGMLRDYPLARHLAAAKLAQYLDGATEIQNVVIARALEKNYLELN